MRWKSVLSIGVLLLVVAALGAGGWLMGRYWAPVLFWSYAGVAALTFLLALLGNFLSYRQRSPLDPRALEMEVLLADIKESTVKRWRFNALLVLSSLAAALTWPASFLALGVSMVKHGLGKREVGSRSYLAAVALNPQITTISIATTAVVVLIMLAHYILPAPYYRRIFLLVLALAVMLHHCAYLIDFESLPAKLRRSISSPYGRFVAIGVADFTTLLLAFSAFIAWGAGKEIDLSELRATATNLLTVGKLRELIFVGTNITWVEGMASIAGGLFLINGFKGVLEFRNFKRTDEDFHIIALRQLTVGDYRKARFWLEKVKKEDALTYELRCCVHLAAGQLEQAEHAAQNYVEEKKLDEAIREIEKNRILICNASATPIPKEILLGYFARWLKTSPTDLYIQTALEGIIRQQRITPKEILLLFEEDAAPERHGLALSSVLIYTDAFDRAAEVLDEYQAQSPAETAAQLCMRYRCLWLMWQESATDEKLAALRTWETDNVEPISIAIKQLRIDWERLIVMEHLFVVCDIAASLKSELTERFSACADDVKNELGGDERVQLTARAMENARIARRREIEKIEALRQGST